MRRVTRALKVLRCLFMLWDQQTSHRTESERQDTTHNPHFDFVAHFDDDDIRAGASQAAAMTTKIKEGTMKAGALRPWFKL